jgi:hypothetical protein
VQNGYACFLTPFSCAEEVFTQHECYQMLPTRFGL